MKATFEFNMDEDRDDYDMYRRAPQYMSAIEEFGNHLRSVLKYETGLEKIPAARRRLILDVYQQIHEKWHEILNAELGPE
jgi:hypothetical protein